MPALPALPGRSFATAVTPQEEEEFRRLASLPNIYEVISKSIAPSIFGGTDMKKAIACLLFGGSRKRWGPGTPRSGEGMGDLAHRRTVTRWSGLECSVQFPRTFSPGTFPDSQACQLVGV